MVASSTGYADSLAGVGMPTAFLVSASESGARYACSTQALHLMTRGVISTGLEEFGPGTAHHDAATRGRRMYRLMSGALIVETGSHW